MLKPEIIVELLDLAGRAQMRWIDSFSSWSAKDRADAYLYKLSQEFYEAVANGADVEKSLSDADAAWRTRTAEQNKLTEAAGKLSSGPYAGQSARMHSYMYPEKFESTAIHLRNMVKIIVNRSKEQSK